jgi:GMP synthase-like glutamine amidotransferase
MPEILIFRFVTHEGPGYFADFLDRRSFPHRVVAIDRHEPIPTRIDGIPGLVFMGGPMSVNDKLPWIPPILELIRQAQAANVPMLGHCLGGQLISKALGGRVMRNPVKEIGWLPVASVDDPLTNDWLGDNLQNFDVFHWHGETFSIPEGAVRILESRACPNQAFVLGQTLALQCHVEMTAAMVREWARVNAAELASPSPTVQSAKTMITDLDARILQMQIIADKLYARWLQGLV